MNSPEIHVRPIAESDLSAFKALRLQALKSHPDSFGADYDESAAKPDAFWLDRMRTSLDNSTGRIVVAEAAGKLVGMAGIQRHGGAKVRHTAHLWGVYVSPEHRGQGVGQQLVNALTDWCAPPNSVRIMTLDVNAANAAAITCYRRCGFKDYGVRPEVIHVDGKYHDELMMWRRV